MSLPNIFFRHCETILEERGIGCGGGGGWWQVRHWGPRISIATTSRKFQLINSSHLLVMGRWLERMRRPIHMYSRIQGLFCLLSSARHLYTPLSLGYIKGLRKLKKHTNLSNCFQDPTPGNYIHTEIQSPRLTIARRHTGRNHACGKKLFHCHFVSN